MESGRLKQIRKQAGYTQDELAEKLNVAASTVGMWEQNRREPDIATLERMANIFGCSLEYLIGFDSQKNNDYIEVISLAKAKGISPERLKKMLLFLEGLD